MSLKPSILAPGRRRGVGPKLSVGGGAARSLPTATTVGIFFLGSSTLGASAEPPFCFSNSRVRVFLSLIRSVEDGGIVNEYRFLSSALILLKEPIEETHLHHNGLRRPLADIASTLRSWGTEDHRGNGELREGNCGHLAAKPWEKLRR
eukprot:EC123369.1.p2 GENE.EC123369.1~~EC123369.1.p2  ORF type:complete len:148 (-),score=10.73 EC123369.1:25-468(-)